MNTRAEKRSLLILAGFLAWVVLAAPAFAAEWQIAETAGSADIWGDTVVYGDARRQYLPDHDHTISNYDVFVFDLATGVEKDIGAVRWDEEEASVEDAQVWGDNVVFVYRDVDHQPSVRVRNLTTAASLRTGTSASFPPVVETWEPTIWEDHLVYLGYNNTGSGGVDVYCTDLTSGVQSRVTSTTAEEFGPHVWGDSIVYERRPDGASSGDIYRYDLLTQEETSLTTSGTASSPVIWGSSVVYCDSRTGGPELYRYDLVHDEETRLTTEPAAHRGFLDIYENTLVFADDRYGSLDLFAYDLVGATETRLTTTFADEFAPAIWGDRIVYSAGVSSASPYGIYLHDPSPSALLTTPKSSPTFYRDMTQSVTGYLKPLHPTGTNPVLIHLWKRSSRGEWVASGYVRATAADMESPPAYTRYEATVEFPSTGSWRLRAYVPGDALHAPGWSAGYRYVEVDDVVVGRPDAPELMRDDTQYTVSGYLKPRHWEDTKPVRIYRWKKLASGQWDSRGYVKATVRDYRSYSRYRARMSFSSAGRWRVRAFHPEDDHERARWSDKYDYVTVTR